MTTMQQIRKIARLAKEDNLLLSRFNKRWMADPKHDGGGNPVDTAIRLAEENVQFGWVTTIFWVFGAVASLTVSKSYWWTETALIVGTSLVLINYFLGLQTSHFSGRKDMQNLFAFCRSVSVVEALVSFCKVMWSGDLNEMNDALEERAVESLNKRKDKIVALEGLGYKNAERDRLRAAFDEWVKVYAGVLFIERNANEYFKKKQ